MLDREIEYQAKLKQQKKELEKLLIEKQQLLDAQRQLSEIARSTLVSDEKGAQKQGKVKDLYILTHCIIFRLNVCNESNKMRDTTILLSLLMHVHDSLYIIVYAFICPSYRFSSI